MPPEQSRSPRRAVSLKSKAEVAAVGGAAAEASAVGDFEGIDFALLGKEQKATFVDSKGKDHPVFVYLPPGDTPREGWPGCVYMHSMAYEAPLMVSCKQESYGMRMARSNFVFVSPITKGVGERDAYLDTAVGENVLAWLSEVVRRLFSRGLPGPDGKLRVNPNALSVTGVSLGGAFTYQLAARCQSMFRCAVPCAAYHAKSEAQRLAEGLSKLAVLCVHSSSPSERTCPISEEYPLWDRIKELGGDFKLKEVHCKHGKTFSHAYEVDIEVWQWILSQCGS